MRLGVVVLGLFGIALLGLGVVATDVILNARHGRPESGKPGPYKIKTSETDIAGIAARVFQPEAGDDPLPLVIYLPGWGGERSENDLFLGDIASWGFVVVAIDDISRDKPAADAPAADEQARTAAFQLSSAADFAAFDVTGRLRTRLQAAKASRLVDALSKDGTASRIAPIDLSRIGVIGFSHGGTSAGVMLANDPRVRAAVNLDGWIRETDADGAPDRPYLILFAAVERLQFPEWLWPGRYWAIKFANLEDKVLHRMEHEPKARIRILSGVIHSDFLIQEDSAGGSGLERWKLWRPWRREFMTTTEVRSIVYGEVIPFLESHVAGRTPQYAPSPSRPGLVKSVTQAYGPP